MSKNCIIIHGCPGSEEELIDINDQTYYRHWIPWAKEKLIKSGVLTETPMMPEPWAPVYKKFKQEFEKYSVNEDSVLVGHSCGSAFLVRWLGESKQKIGKLILVAPWKIDTEDKTYRGPFYGYEIDSSIKDRVNKIIMFTSDDEEEDGKKSLKIFHDALGGEIVELKSHGHYIESEMGTIEFPELIKAITE